MPGMPSGPPDEPPERVQCKPKPAPPVSSSGPAADKVPIADGAAATMTASAPNDTLVVFGPELPKTQANAGSTTVITTLDGRPQAGVLPESIAQIVSTLATMTDLTARSLHFWFELLLDAGRWTFINGTTTVRRLLINAITAARRAYIASHAALKGTGSSSELDEDHYYGVLEGSTALGVYLIEKGFSFVELLSMAGFHFAGKTAGALRVVAQELASAVDTLFGSNESSKVLSGIVALLRHEFSVDKKNGLMKNGFLAAMSAMTKAIAAYALLQHSTAHRMPDAVPMTVMYDRTVLLDVDARALYDGEHVPGPPQAVGTEPASAGSVAPLPSSPTAQPVESQACASATLAAPESNGLARVESLEDRQVLDRVCGRLWAHMAAQQQAEDAATIVSDPELIPLPPSPYLSPVADDASNDFVEEVTETVITTHSFQQHLVEIDESPAPSTHLRRRSEPLPFRRLGLAPLTPVAPGGITVISPHAAVPGQAAVPSNPLKPTASSTDDAGHSIPADDHVQANINAAPTTLAAKERVQIVFRKTTTRHTRRERSPRPTLRSYRSLDSGLSRETDDQSSVWSMGMDMEGDTTPSSTGSAVTYGTVDSPRPSDQAWESDATSAPELTDAPLDHDQGPSSHDGGDEPQARVPPSTPANRSRSGTLRSGHAQQPSLSSIEEVVAPINDIPELSQAPVSATETPTRLFPHDQLAVNIHRYMRFASAAYGQSFLRYMGIGKCEEMFETTKDTHANTLAFAQHTGVPVEDVILSSYTDKQPAWGSTEIPPLVHFLAIDHRLKAVVLTCRGTLGLSDVLVDLCCDYEQVELDARAGDDEFYAHSGMLSAAVALTKRPSRVFTGLCKALTDNPSYGLVLTGHSLGGGVASLLSILLATKSTKFVQQCSSMDKPPVHPPITTPFVTGLDSGLPPGRPIHCWAYGIPAVASPDLLLYCKGLVSSIVHRDDVVPTLSLGVLRDVKEMTEVLEEEPGLAEHLIRQIVGAYCERLSLPALPASMLASRFPPLEQQAKADWMLAVKKTLKAHMSNDKLYPPGDVYIIESNDVWAPLDEAKRLAGHTKHSRVKQGQRVILRRCDNVEERFREPLFSKTMMGDHTPNGYEKTTQLLVEGLDIVI